MDYEFTLLFELNLSHLAKSTKDRTGLFMDKSEFVITESTGELIKDWCNSGTDLIEARAKILGCNTLDELKTVYNQYSNWFSQLESDFKTQKDFINNQLITQN